MLPEYWFCNKNPFPAKEHPKRRPHPPNPMGYKSPSTITNWWPNARLLLPPTLARHPVRRELIDHHPELDGAPGRTTTGDRMMIRSCVRLGGRRLHRRHADVLRTGGAACTLAGAVKTSSTPPRGREGRLWAPYSVGSGGATSANRTG